MKKEIKKRGLGKRGLSHVEIVLSFVIFTGFLVFLFAIFNPLKISGGKNVYLDLIERKILDEVSINIEFLSIKLTSELSECFCFGYDFGEDGRRDMKVSVKNENYEFVNAISGSGSICIDDRGSFFYITASEDFEEKPVAGCRNLQETEYTLGLFRDYEMVSNKKLNELHEDLLKKYGKKKEKFGLSSQKEFSISVRNATDDVILNTTKEPPKKVVVLARDIPIQIVYKDGNIKNAKLNIRVW